MTNGLAQLPHERRCGQGVPGLLRRLRRRGWAKVQPTTVDLLKLAGLETVHVPGRSDITAIREEYGLSACNYPGERHQRRRSLAFALEASTLEDECSNAVTRLSPPQTSADADQARQQRRSMDEADEAEDTRPWQPGTTSRWSWYRGLGSPSRVLAPMVDQSEPQHGQGAGRPAGADLLAPQLTAPAAWDARLRALAVTRSGHSGSARGAPQPLRSQWRLTVRLQLSSCSAQLSACHRRLFHCL